MEYRRFGRTGLPVSVAGLGTGGPSNLGQNTGVSEADAIRVVHRALDLGINLIDTAAGYKQSEAILGRALRDVPRDSYVLASKFTANDQEQGTVFPVEVLEQSLHESLRRLGVEYLDVFQFHGVQARLYDRVMECFLPEARRWQQQGKFRFLGITENFRSDGTHQMLQQALTDDHFDTMMVGYNLLAPGAERVVLPQAQLHDVGVMVMFAVRAGALPAGLPNGDDPGPQGARGGRSGRRARRPAARLAAPRSRRVRAERRLQVCRRPPGHFNGAHRDGQHGSPGGQRAVTGGAAAADRRPVPPARYLRPRGREHRQLGAGRARKRHRRAVGA